MPAPGQLPPAPPNFTGRVRELATLHGLLDGQPARSATLAVIMGVGGIGKTSLALRWLHEIREHFPDGQLYADLAGHQPDAAEQPETILGRFLRALGLPAEQVPVQLAEQTAVWRSMTDGRRLAILLDNVVSAAQARVLLPGPGPSVAAVTTRWRIGGLAVDGGRFIELGPLDEPDALELLDRVAGQGRTGAEPQASAMVVRLCGHLPLALCVTGARLAPRPRWPIARIAAELASEQSRLTALHLTEDMSVRAAFDASYQALAPPVQRAYRLLALAPGAELSQGLAAAALDVPAYEAVGLLDALAEASMLEEIGDERYRYHDLVRLHARGQAVAVGPAAELEAAAGRGVRWYLAAAVSADLVVIPGRWRLNPMYDQARRDPPAFSSAASALDFLEDSLPGLLAAVQAAHDQGFHELAWQLCEAMWGLFLNRKHYQQWIAAHLTGLAAAQACDDSRAEARMRVQLGYALLSLREYAQAADHFAEALTLSRRDGHHVGEATALEYLALTDLRQSQPGRAIGAFREALAIYERIGRARGIAMMTRHIGEAHLEAGHAGDAIASFSQARALFAAMPDSYQEARSLIGLGQAHLADGQSAAATDLLRQALVIATRVGASHEEARVRVALAGAGDRDARCHLEAALDIYSRAGAPEAADVRRQLDALDSGGAQQARSQTDRTPSG